MSEKEGWLFPAVLDASGMKEYKSCPRKWWHKYVEGKSLQGVAANVDLIAGRALAKGMEVGRKVFWVEGEDAEMAVEAGIEAMLEEYGKDRPEEVKNHERLKEAYRKYWKKWPMSRDRGIVPIEEGIEGTFSFEIPGLVHPDTGQPLLYAGKRDMIGREIGEDDPFGEGSEGDLWGVDEKTCGYVNDGWQHEYELDWQFLGYTYFERVVAGNDIEGVIIRKIGLKRKVFDGRSDLKQAKIRYDGKVLEDWYQEMIQTAAEMVWKYEEAKIEEGLKGIPQVFGNACNEYSGCQSRPICLHKEVLPEYTIFRWNPLTREKEKEEEEDD